jgi:catechol 2,3-dioxygenase-like lactoylglutathione lyase family enzyme
MGSIDFLILYVHDVAASVRFWTEVLGAPPVEASPGFAMFVRPDGAKLGLWLAPAVQPAATASAGASEVCFAVGSNDAVDAAWADARARGRAVLQDPTAMDFGYTFTFADPDGHRVRVMAPNPG